MLEPEYGTAAKMLDESWGLREVARYVTEDRVLCLDAADAAERAAGKPRAKASRFRNRRVCRSLPARSATSET
ncbi:hypothetical protein [Raoultibacter phocaeensis]|uniref:hypothetical protein n=1 Tax=Raoultibacter phocaeensis TaxID=2479841 RepID=UPI00111B9CBC|nr:hypothetical protein [Raoultibacter phocaeensis]